MQVFAMTPRCDLPRRLRAARRPVVLAGIAAPRAGAHRALARLAETRTAVGGAMSKGVLAEEHAYYAARWTWRGNAFMWDFLNGLRPAARGRFDAVELIKPWQLSVRR